MVEEKELCIEEEDARTLIDMGLELAEAFTEEVKVGKERGVDVSELEKSIKKGKRKLKALQKRLKV